MSDQTPDPSDPYADLRRTLPPMRPRPTAPTRPSATGHSSPSGRLHHYGPAIECPNPICAFLAAANPDTIAALLAERDMLAEDGALHGGDIEDLTAERDALAAERSNLMALLAELVDSMVEPCRYDHHDRCQDHMLHPADECPVAQAAAILPREDRP